jgi:hypothetical protein
VALAYARGVAGRDVLVRGWNVLGLLDLAVAITTGFLTSPSAFQAFSFDAPNELISGADAGLPQSAPDQPQFSGPSTIRRASGSAPSRTQPSSDKAGPLGFWRHSAVDQFAAASTPTVNTCASLWLLQ